MDHASHEPRTDGPLLSVVLACPTADVDPFRALEELDADLRGLRAEILLVRPDGDGPRSGALREVPADGVRRIPAPADALVPHLWAIGYHESNGRVVAFTTSHMRVEPGWAEALLGGLRDAAAAGGPIRLGDEARLLDRAIHLLRYSDFAADRRPPNVEEIPGDNAAYRRDVLGRNEDLLREGFWEVEVHRRLRAQGKSIAWVPAARARLERSYDAVTFLRQRYRHGRHFGRYRAHELGTPVLRIVALAPLVPAVMAFRALSRSKRQSGGLPAALPALPWLLLAASAWAAGEARGALSGGGRSPGSRFPT